MTADRAVVEAKKVVIIITIIIIIIIIIIMIMIRSSRERKTEAHLASAVLLISGGKRHLSYIKK